MTALHSLRRDARRIRVAAERLAHAFVAGGYRSVFRGQGVEFDEVREYQDGDDVRTIDWNVTSRLGGAYSKVFREERELNLFLLVDLSASVTGGTTEKAEMVIWIAAILALSAELNDDRIGAALFTDRIESWVTPAKGRTRVLRLVNDLLGARAQGTGSDLRLALRAMTEGLTRRGICILLSDFKTDGYWRELRTAARSHDVIAIRITEPLDIEIPADLGLDLVDPETGLRRFAAGLGGSHGRYREFWALHFHTWRSRCRRAGVEYLEVSVDEDPGVALARFFRSRRRHSR